VVVPVDGAVDLHPVVGDTTAAEEEPTRAHHERVATLPRSLRLVMKGGGSSAKAVVVVVVAKVVDVAVAVVAAAVLEIVLTAIPQPVLPTPTRRFTRAGVEMNLVLS